MKRQIALLWLVLSIACSRTAPRTEVAVQPPAASRIPHETVLHGQKLVDDYYWLREKGSPAVTAYLAAENAYADAVMKPTQPLQETLYKEMLGRIKETDMGVPMLDHGYWYYTRTEQGKQYPIYCRKKGTLESPEEVTVDLNQLGQSEKYIGLGGYWVSPDNGLLAYSIDTTGFRVYTLYVKDLRKGQLLEERIPRVDSVAWASDGKTLFYTVENDAKRSYRLYRHRLGSKSPDPLVYEEKDEMFELNVGRTRSDAYLLLASNSHTASEVRYLAAGNPDGSWQVVAPREKEHEYDVDHRGDLFYIRTNSGGRNFRLVTAPVSGPGNAGWKELVPHRENVMLEGIDLFQDQYVLFEREDGLPQLRVTDFKTGSSHRIEFPEQVYSVFPGGNAEFKTTLYRFNYQSPITPSSVYDYDVQTRQRKLLKQQEVLGGYDASRYQTERVLAPASDGTKVPISIVYRKGLTRDGKAPLHLYAYGSYGMSMPDTFNSNAISLLDRGVVLATAHIRGGGEMGKKWHDQGRMMSKMNTFTDFISCAEYLLAQGYGSKDMLAIEGGSAGGLLMGAVTNMRPDLFKVVVSHVPFVDVINTMLDESLPLTVGEFEEWGNPKIKEQYDYMIQYSPYDKVAKKAYPALLVKTSLNDSQVMYWEPAKYVAKLRAMKTDSNLLVFKINMDPAGHGGQSGRYNRLREIAFDYAFILWQLGIVKS